jgi:UDP-N-acetylglucosamine 2-epimerase
MKTVMTIVGTRPEIIKLSRVIPKLDTCSTHLLTHTGQNYDYELNEIFFENLGIRRPDFFLNAAGTSPADTIANVISRSYELLQRTSPDCILLYGDTNSCLSVIAAKRLRIPVFHMEAGNRCFDQRVPEELNRKVVDHLSDVNMTITEHARRYLISEGLRPELTFAVGSSMPEVFAHFAPQVANSEIISTLGLNENSYFVVSSHREENVDSPAVLARLVESLTRLAIEFGFPICFSTHPRTRARLERLGINDFHPLLRFLKPLGFFDYIRLQRGAHCVISDSGTITEEAAILGFPAITIRQAHERPEGMDRGILIMSDISPDSILGSVKAAVALTPLDVKNNVSDYDNPRLSETVCKIILSYTDYVNRTIWGK